MNFHSGAESPLAATAAEIAHQDVFTVKEKMELLYELKADLLAGLDYQDPDVDGSEEIDAAIEEVKLSARNGAETPPVSRWYN